jgi:hypothetical protein
MPIEGFKAFFRMGAAVLVMGVLLLCAVRPGTAEFVVTVMSIGIGLTLMVLAALVSRWMS